jgi:hypothetical protein
MAAATAVSDVNSVSAVLVNASDLELILERLQGL